MDILQSSCFGKWPDMDEDIAPVIAPPKIVDRAEREVIFSPQTTVSWAFPTPAIMPTKPLVITQTKVEEPQKPTGPFSANWTQPVPLNSHRGVTHNGIATASAFRKR